MCGIAGIVKLDPRGRVERVRLERMLDALRHRGPDGEGLFMEGPVGLAHRRLAIVDVSGGRQPMPGENGSAWIAFNGEIYNHPQLRPQLEAHDHHYRTRCDTETILHLYEEEGDRCVERMRGMFAFALWDRARGRLLLGRDRLGIKPLYWACTGEEILFASEIKAILAAGPLKASFDETVLPEFLANRLLAGEETFFRGVRKLLPGRTLSWSPEEGFRTARYWRPRFEADGSSAPLSRLAAGLREKLAEAVRVHLMSDVPLGLFLSGGIDSSALAALMAPMVREPIRTFSVGFDEPGASELPYARLMAEHVGAEHREIVVSAEQFFAALPRLVWQQDEPMAFPAGVPLHFVSRLAREHVKVVLTGEGADELFCGYNRYRVTLWNHRLERVCRRVLPGSLLAGLSGLSLRPPGRLGRVASRSFLARPSEPRWLFYDNFSVFPIALQQRLLSDPALLAARDPYGGCLALYEDVSGGPLERMCGADLQSYLVELLMKQDRMSMAASIESRVPYLDHPLVDWVTAMPAHTKLRGFRTKALLREALRGLVPREILTRRKMGFPVPVGRWLRGRFWPVVEQFVLSPRVRARGLFDAGALARLAGEHRCGVADHGERLWLLINLELWMRLFLDGDDALDVKDPQIETIAHAVPEAIHA